MLESKGPQRVRHGRVTEQQEKQTHSHHKLPPPTTSTVPYNWEGTPNV